MVILGKVGSAKAYSYCSVLFFSHSEKLVIYTFIGHNLSSIDILYNWISLNLLVLYIIACCIRSDM